MNFDTPLVEYLIIGVHTSAWMYFIFLKLLNYPLSTLSKLDTSLVILLLPFMYIIGMIFDDITYRILRTRIANIKADVRKSREAKKNKAGGATESKRRGVSAADYKDETLANRSEVLYNAYEARIRRVRIIGSAIFNWPLLGLTIAINLGLKDPILIALSIATVTLTLFSWLVWNGLYIRAYEFRLKAIDEVIESADK